MHGATVKITEYLVWAFLF